MMRPIQLIWNGRIVTKVEKGLSFSAQTGAVVKILILYIDESRGCRQCQGLLHESQRENDCNRTSRVADKLRDRLGWKRDFLHGEGYRPKGMHRATFERLVSSHQHASQQTLKGLAERFNLI